MIHIKSMKGIVVEVEKGSVIVLTSEAELLDVETNGQNYEIGEEISFNKLVETKKAIRWDRVLSHTSALAASVLLFFTGIPLLDDGVNSGSAYAATIYVESKSSVQVSINQDQRVINTSPMDTPAKKILKDISWKDEPINKFIDDYFHSERDHGYLTKNDKVIIAELQPSTKIAVKTLQTIEKTISTDKDLDSNNVLTVTVPAAVVEKAKSIGVTPGKYAFYLAAKDQGKEIPTNVLKTSSVTELINSDTTVAAALPKYSADKLATLANENMAVASVPVKSNPASKPAMPSNPDPKSTGTSTAPTQATTQPTTTTQQPSTTQQASAKQAESPKQDNKQDTEQDNKQNTKQDGKQDNNTNTNDIIPVDTKPLDNGNPKSKDPSPTLPKDGQGKDAKKPVPLPAQPTVPTETNKNVPTVPIVTTTPSQPTTQPSVPPATPTTPPPNEQPVQPAQPGLIKGLFLCHKEKKADPLIGICHDDKHLPFK